MVTKKTLDHLHSSLQGKVLIATKALDDSYFERCIIYVCSHDDEGALGVIINKIEKTCDRKGISKTFPNLSELIQHDSKLPIYTGGPLDDAVYYVLFDDASILKREDSLSLFDNAELYLRDYFCGINHSPFLLLKGFCSWGPGQLEEEVKENSWLVTTMEQEKIFNDKNKKSLWNQAIKKLGISNFNGLVNYSGNA